MPTDDLIHDTEGQMLCYGPDPSIVLLGEKLCHVV